MAIKDWPGGVISKTPVVPAGTNANSAASGVWTLDQVAYWQKQGIWPNPANVVDPYFYDVTLLLTGDGTNGAQNNTFLDSSTNNFTITRNGNTTQGTFSPYGNLWSNYFDGSGDYLTVAGGMPSGASSAFTMECWIYLNDISNYRAITRGNASSQLEWGITTAGELKLDNVGVANICTSATNTIQANRWYHVAVTRSASNIYKMWVNGVNVATSSTYATSMTANTTIGYSSFSAANFFIGYISNFRVVTSEVYTSNFTPSTTPLTAVSGTSLLTCQSNRFRDNSSNNFTLTVNGNTSVQRFSPFNPTAPYSAATIGGSGYFDGNGDYLTAPSSASFDFSSSDFTVEGWFFDTAVNSAPHYFQFGSSGTNRWNVLRYTGNTIQLFSNPPNSFYNTGVTAPLNTWFHLAISKSSTTTKVFLNGTQIYSTTAISFPSGNQVASIGWQNYGGGTADYLSGYVSNFRVVKGTAVYTSNFTPPTAPLTAITNTSLLCNFTNAGIPDAAMMNDLETVGNAQVSTSVKKYGTGSLYFDGSGDYLSIPLGQSVSLGTGDFTIECWVYLNAYNATYGSQIAGCHTYGIGADYFFNINTTGKLYFQIGSGSGLVTSTSSVPLSTWTHIALVRSGNAFTPYINGVNAGGAATSTSAVNSTRAFTVGDDLTGAAGAALNGYIDDLRITKGYARYTANFTPPTAALPTF